METLLSIDYQLSLLINSAHNPMLDELMMWFSSKWFWVPLYLFLIWAFAFRNTWRTTAFFLLAIAVLIFLSDQTSVHAFKFQFERLRPCHNPDLKELLHLPDGCGGKFGFVSSHATNTMALATFLVGIFKYRWIHFILFFYVFANVYSRVYLGVHFVGDVLGGMLLGLLFGLGMSFFFNRNISFARWL